MKILKNSFEIPCNGLNGYLYSLNKGFSALARSDVLESDMDSLGNNSVSDQFVHNHTDGSGVHVEHFSGSSLVVFERHSLVIFKKRK